MRTSIKNLLGLIFLIGTVSGMNGQSFSMKGSFFDENEKAISAGYTLTADNTVVSSGEGKKINILLKLNQNYCLTITKEGHQSKTIYFSTFTEKEKDFRFLFRISLAELEDTLASNKLAGEVFYDMKSGNFNYKAY